MPGTNGAAIRLTDRLVRMAVRLLLFLLLVAGLIVLGGLLFPAAAATETLASLLLGSALTLAAACLAGGLLLVRLEGRSFGALGLAWTPAVPREIVAGIGIGAGSTCLAVVGLVGVGAVHFEPAAGGIGAWLGAVVAGLGTFAVPAVAEEALFRGYAFQVLVVGIGAAPATVVGSGAFAAAHLANPDWDGLALMNLFLAGVLLSVAYLRTRSLWFASAVHLGWNWGTGSLMDLPVSGLDFIDTPGYEPVLTGGRWLTGGSFGPEGGIGATFAFLFALTAVLRLPGLRETERMRQLRPLVDGAEGRVR